MKTVGVLGGLGPQATMDFEDRFHRAAQRSIPQAFNQGYPPLVVLYVRHLPFLLGGNGMPRFPLEPDPRLFEAARQLGTVADFLVIASNAPHLFVDEVRRAAGRPVLDMIELAVDEVRRRGWRRVGVVGLGEPTVYTRPLAARGVTCETIEPALRADLDRGIVAVMEGRANDASTAGARRAVGSLRNRGVDGVVLGCTEIPLLLGDEAAAADLLNPVQLLAEAAVRHATAG